MFENQDGRSEQRELRRLKWVGVLGPLLFLALLELVRNVWSASVLDAWPGYILIAGVVLIGTLFFAETIFGIIGRMQQRLFRQNQELIALHDAGIAITSELDLEVVLQSVVDQAREVGSARYGALSLIREDGGTGTFLTSGISREQRAKMGPVPERHGLLGAVLEERTAMRIPDVSADPRSVGIPPNHPLMRTLLAVPVHSHRRILGSLYLAEKEDDDQFSDDDLRRLERFATQAAIAIENARLHQQVRSLAITEERERIAREMHDTIAQVLGYVNTKAQAAQELLRQERPEQAEAQIAQLSKVAREAYADVREDILGLRMSRDEGRSLIETIREYVQRWEEQSSVRSEFTLIPPETEHLELASLAELQLLRIIQESLANVRKHARATTVRVELRKSPSEVEATVCDDGVGFERELTVSRDFPRFGLTTMRERAESVSGSLDIQSEPGEGTRVVARIPTQSQGT